MPEEKNDLKSLEFIYQELKESWDFQKESLSTIQTKANWTLSTDALLLVAILFQVDELNAAYIISLSLFLLSILCILVILWIWNFVRGPSHKELLDASKYSYEAILKKISPAKIQAMNMNQKKLDQLKLLLNLSVFFLFLGLVVLFFTFIFKTYCYA